MEGFPRVAGHLYSEGIPLERVAAAVHTPTYVYSAGTIRAQWQALATALAGIPHRVHYALKANSTLGVLQVLRACGACADVVSGGELYRAQRAGFAARDIVFDGPGKGPQELREAIAAGVACINVESADEARLISAIATELGVEARLGLRVNPEVSVENFHPYISTGEEGDKFGIPIDQALDVARLVRTLPGVRLIGLHMHVGSMLSGFRAFEDALGKLGTLVDALRALDAARGHEITLFDIGGGLPIPYADEPESDLAHYADVVRRAHARTGCTILVEPGRLLVGACGVILSRVLYRKRSGGREYVIVDAAMNDLIRPPLYDAYHHIEGVAPAEGRGVFDVVGPVCESGDFFAHRREMDDVRAGDLVVLRTTGAYGSVMASNYNARGRAAEVLVDGDQFAVVRARETYADMVRLDVATPDWRQE